MGVAGLADGFLAGFNTVDRYERGKKADERMDQEMSLRNAAWQNEQDRQNVADQRYKEESDYRKSRDESADHHWGLDYEARNKQINAQINRANALTGISESQNKMAQDSHNLMMSKAERDQWFLNNGPAANLAILAAIKNKPLTQDQKELLDNKHLAGINPFRVLGDPAQHEATGRVFNNMKSMIGNPEARKWDSQQLYSAINTPQNKKDFSTIFKNDLEKNIGTMTPYGVIKSYGDVAIVPSSDGNFHIDSTVTYQDPKTGKDVIQDHVPITENRTGDPSDNVKSFSGSQLLNYFGKRFQLNNLATQYPQQVEDYLTQVGLNKPVDYKGLAKSLASINVQRAKAKANADSADQKPIDEQFDNIEQKTMAIYGANQQGANLDYDSPDSAAGKWASGDPERVKFIQEADQDSSLGSLMNDPARMNMAFSLWQQKAEKQRQQEAKQRQQSQDSVSAASLRDARQKAAYQAMSRQ